MLVRFTASRPGEGYVAGQSYDLKENEARHWIKRGFAVAAAQSAAQPAAAAASPPPAARPRRRQ